MEKIREMLGAQALQSIMTKNNKPQAQPLIQDKVIWTGSNRDRYSTKEGYKKLIQQCNNTVYGPTKIEAWKRIWCWKGVIPRVKMFLWKAVHGGIATLAELHKRIRPICPKCPRCGEENEFTNHVLFFCPLSRATWFMSELAFKVKDLPLDSTRTLLDLTDCMDETQILQLYNLIWCIWKARNEVIFQSKTPTPFSIIRQAKQMDPPTGSEHSNNPVAHSNRTTEVISIPPHTCIFFY